MLMTIASTIALIIALIALAQAQQANDRAHAAENKAEAAENAAMTARVIHYHAPKPTGSGVPRLPEFIERLENEYGSFDFFNTANASATAQRASSTNSTGKRAAGNGA